MLATKIFLPKKSLVIPSGSDPSRANLHGLYGHHTSPCPLDSVRVPLGYTGRKALIFSAGTRNSLVVLPLALALPDDWILASAVIVTQTLVELVGELFYIRLVPSVVFR